VERTARTRLILNTIAMVKHVVMLLQMCTLVRPDVRMLIAYGTIGQSASARVERKILIHFTGSLVTAWFIDYRVVSFAVSIDRMFSLGRLMEHVSRNRRSQLYANAFAIAMCKPVIEAQRNKPTLCGYSLLLH